MRISQKMKENESVRNENKQELLFGIAGSEFSPISSIAKLRKDGRFKEADNTCFFFSLNQKNRW
jgi:hypothetical protein